MQDDGRNYGARTEISLLHWFREASHWVVPDYYPDEGRFTTRNFNSAAASYEVEVHDPYVQAPIPPSAERPLPVYTEEPTPAPVSVSRQPTGTGMDHAYPATGVPPSSGPMRVPQVPSSSRAPLSVSGPIPRVRFPRAFPFHRLLLPSRQAFQFLLRQFKCRQALRLPQRLKDRLLVVPLGRIRRLSLRVVRRNHALSEYQHSLR